jgi:hypothetical protein
VALDAAENDLAIPFTENASDFPAAMVGRRMAFWKLGLYECADLFLILHRIRTQNAETTFTFDARECTLKTE